MTVYLHSLGCDKNLVDSEVMLGLLYDKGYKSVDPSQAEMIVVNTCGFIQEAVEEGINTILELAAYKESGKCKTLIVTGCMAQRYRAEILQEIPEVDEILGVNDFPKIVGLDIDVLDDKLFEKRISTMPLHVAYVKISEGCNNCCTYCTIPKIRGSYRERKMESIVKECQKLVENGAKEIVLIAQDTAKYGTSLYGEQRLHELVKQVAAIQNIGWVRVMYAYPEHVYPELIEVISNTPNVCSYIDMPIQHSHAQVALRMGRKNTDLRRLISDLQNAGITIRTTLIVGFPGETDDEFTHLRQFVEEVKFDHLGAFPYSKEDGTPAAAMEGQIKSDLKKLRHDEMMTLQAGIAEQKTKTLVGQTIKIMVDGIVVEEDGEIVYSGRSQRDAYEVDGAAFFTCNADIISGSFVMIKVTRSQGYDVYGELVQIIED